MKKLTFLLLFFHVFLIKGQCDVAITDVNFNTYEVTIEVINSEGCTANGPGGVNGAVTMLQIGYHLPEAIDPDNEVVDLLTLPDAPCSPQWVANGFTLGMVENQYSGWWYSPSTSVTFQEDIMGDGLTTGDVVVIPLNPPGDYINYPTPLAECGDDLIDYWLSEGECIEFVVWQLNYGATWHTANGGWAETANGYVPNPSTYQDPNCNNSWYTCRDENPGAAVANPDFCEVVLDECNDPIACNYNENWGGPGGFCIYCDTPNGEELCEEYQNVGGYWNFYFNAFDCLEETENDTIYIELPPDTVTIIETDTIFVELPPDTIYEVDTLIITVTEVDTLYIELPPDTVTITEVDTVFIELPPDTVTITEVDTVFIELPPDTVTITETEFIFVVDTIVETEYITVIDTTYVLYTDTVYVYEFIEIDCETGLPCSETRCSETDIYIPNAFTPDNDGYNDAWEIVLDPECWTDIKAQVISKWGVIVWESNDPNNLIWNGSLQNGDYYIQNEMYTWFLQARKIGTTEIKDLRGHVTAIR